jgi:glutamyl-tRNA reductase
MRMKYIYEEDTPARVSYILPHVQLLISLPSYTQGQTIPQLSAARIAKGCDGRHIPLLIFDLAPYPHASVEELAGLLPTVCLYTPDDLRHILAKQMAKAC